MTTQVRNDELVNLLMPEFLSEPSIGTAGVLPVLPSAPAPGAPGLPGAPGAPGTSSGNIILRITTLDATPTEMLQVDNTHVAVPRDTVWTFRVAVVAAVVCVAKAAGYELTGVIRNENGATALVGTVTQRVLGETDAGWNATVDADGDTLRVMVTGAAATTIKWVALLEVVPVTFLCLGDLPKPVPEPAAGTYKRVLVAANGRFFWTEDIWAATPVWAEMTTGLTAVTSIYQLALDPFDWTHLFAVTDQGIFHNTAWRTGGTWTSWLSNAEANTLAGLGGNHATIEGIAVTTARLGRFVVSVRAADSAYNGYPTLFNYAMCFLTNNSGSSWTVTTVSTGSTRSWAHPLRVGQHNKDRVYGVYYDAGGWAWLAVSSDAGATWTNTATGSAYAYNITIPYATLTFDEVLYFPGGVVHAHGRKSTDGGLTWNDFPSIDGVGNLEWRGDSADVVMCTRGTGYRGNYSLDETSTWNSLYFPVDLYYDPMKQMSTPAANYWFGLADDCNLAGAFSVCRLAVPTEIASWLQKAAYFVGLGIKLTCFTIDPAI